MADAHKPTQSAMVHANDKLLKALVILLALRDDDLLPELRTVFAGIMSENSELRDGNAETWAHLRHELELITSMVSDADDHGADDDHDGAARFDRPN